MKGICLCSGGLDSTLSLLKLLEEGHTVIPLFVDYNQWPAEEEERAFRVVLQHVKIQGQVIRVDLGDSGRVGDAWGRTVALVGLAAMWAYTHGDCYQYIALGNHKGDTSPGLVPGPERVDKLNDALQEATKGRMTLIHPILELTNEDIGRALVQFSIPWSFMYSCYWSPNCGYRSVHETYRCPGCRRKTIAMKAAGVLDDSLYLPNGGVTYQSELAEKADY